MTTSWDDGSIWDMKIAELLKKYDMPGTFYVAKEGAPHRLSEPQIFQLGKEFEIGAHTLRHIPLPKLRSAEKKEEIVRSKEWIESVTGKTCRMFCFPKGKFTFRDLGIVFEAGYQGVRTVALLSTGFPYKKREIAILDTTLQTVDHSRSTYLKNSFKRRRFTRAFDYLLKYSNVGLEKKAEILLNRVRYRGGVFHLWGHSWEIQFNNGWSQFENILKAMRSFTQDIQGVFNGEICRYAE